MKKIWDAWHWVIWGMAVLHLLMGVVLLSDGDPNRGVLWITIALWMIISGGLWSSLTKAYRRLEES